MAECRIVYPVVAGSNPAVLALSQLVQPDSSSHSLQSASQPIQLVSEISSSLGFTLDDNSI
jgi:hypothetical protein